MPDADPNGQTAETSSDGGGQTGSRSLESFPEEAQDYIRRLRSEAAGYRNDLKASSAKLKEFEDAKLSELEKVRAEHTEAIGRATSAETRLLRYDVAAEKGIPLNLAGRLQGSTKEELAADADKLKKDFGLEGESGDTGRPGFDGGVRRSVKKPKTMNELIRQGAGR